MDGCGRWASTLAIVAAVLHVIGLIVEDALTGEGIIASMVHGFKTMSDRAAKTMRDSGHTPLRLVGGTLTTVVIAIAASLGTGTLNWPVGEHEEHEEHEGQSHEEAEEHAER